MIFDKKHEREQIKTERQTMETWFAWNGVIYAYADTFSQQMMYVQNANRLSTLCSAIPVCVCVVVK